ncbi:MAG TPA: hypothetical protein VJ872_15200 [Nocardioides sp.]|nr:hypothetical protein [Nocardioides sp.]
MSTAVRALLLAVVFTALPVTVGVAMTGGRAAAPPATYSPTALGDLDTTTMTIGRASFCDRLPAAAVTDALGQAATYADSYGDGDRRAVPGNGADVLHEYGCVFRAGATEARAWVFAPPVGVARAKQLAAARTPGCRVLQGAPAFGRPSVAGSCGTKTSTVTFRGLFGDAWLSCSLSGAGAASTLVDRTERWCAAVAQADQA